MAMRKVTENEIYGLNGELLTLDYLLAHTHRLSRVLIKAIKHVDTRLRQDSRGLHWRVQGYIPLDKFNEICEELYPKSIQCDAFIGIGFDCLELWSLGVDYEE